jgi:flagellar basal-body rod modification protein FlgD
MDVSGLNGLLGSLGTPTTTAPTKKNDELDRTDFLNLLIAQLQNQDPMNPLESADFSAQLAQFSSLEQLMQINQKLTEDAASGGVGSLDALGFLGQEVGYESDELTVAEGAVPTFDLQLDAQSQVKVEILDGAGQVVGTADLGILGAGRQSVDLSAIGAPPDLDDGKYQLRVVATDGSGGQSDLTPIFRARVDGVDLAGESPVLLVGDRRLSVSDIREIRTPPASSESSDATDETPATETSGA